MSQYTWPGWTTPLQVRENKQPPLITHLQLTVLSEMLLPVARLVPGRVVVAVVVVVLTPLLMVLLVVVCVLVVLAGEHVLP